MDALQSPLLAGLMFPVTAGLLWWSSRQTPGETSYVTMSWRQALLVVSIASLVVGIAFLLRARRAPADPGQG